MSDTPKTSAEIEPFEFAVFFPPRIIYPDMTKGDHNAVLDDVRDRYLDEGIVMVDIEKGVAEAYKIIAFAEANYPHLLHNNNTL